MSSLLPLCLLYLTSFFFGRILVCPSNPLLSQTNTFLWCNLLWQGSSQNIKDGEPHLFLKQNIRVLSGPKGNMGGRVRRGGVWLGGCAPPTHRNLKY